VAGLASTIEGNDMLKGTVIETAYYDILDRHLVPVLVALRLKPNHITFAGFLVSLLAGVLFAYSTLAGGVLTLLTGLLDTLDGSLARTLGEAKKYGAFLDSVLDRYTELVIYLGIWCYFYQQGHASGWLSLILLLILFGSLMVSYTRARAEGLGQPCVVGVFQRGERIIVIGLAGIINPLMNFILVFLGGTGLQDLPLVAALFVLAVGTNLTALWRFLHVLNNLRRS
jgi:CDP-diacylglycerol---glycerol-3-phosphate 3-phosphatidyltransferase